MADKKKSEQIKLYAVIGLVVVAGIVAYFQFFHKSSPTAGSGIPGVTSVSVFSDLEVPKIDFASLSKSRPPESGNRIVKITDIRDIFSPKNLPKPKIDAEEALKAMPIPSFALSGTILGGGYPIAIINGKSLRKGDEMSGFEVLEISQNEAKLSNSVQEIVLRVLEPQ